MIQDGYYDIYVDIENILYILADSDAEYCMDDT